MLPDAFEREDKLVVRPRPDVTQTKPARFSDEAGDLHRPVLLVDVWTIIVRNVEELAVGCQPALQVLDSASGHPRVSRRLIRPRNNFFAGLRGEGLRQQGLFKTTTLITKPPLRLRNRRRGRSMLSVTLPPAVR